MQRLKKMDKALVKPIEWLQRTKCLLLNLKLSDYDDKNHVNNVLDAIQCIDNAMAVLNYEENKQ